MVISLFITPENGILMQDSFAMNSAHANLLGLEVPYFYFLKKVCKVSFCPSTMGLGYILSQIHCT